MAELRFSRGFIEDLAQIPSQRVLTRVYEALAPLETLPCYGSRDIPTFAQKHFGEELYKLFVAPYDIYYHYDKTRDIVEIDGLIPMRLEY